MADYVLNMGGYSDYSTHDTVDVFHVTEKSIEHVTGLTLSEPRRNLAAATCGAYTLAMGGLVDAGSYSNAIDVFRATENGVEAVTGHGLTLSARRDSLAAAAAGNYIVALGGYDGTNYSNAIDVFRATENGVEAVTGHGLTLSVARSDLVAVSIGDYIMALGGKDATNSYNTVDVFRVTQSGVVAVTGHGLTLSTARYNLAAAACGNYILVMGGKDSGGGKNTIDIFKLTDTGIVKVTDYTLTLSQARSALGAAASGEYILALGGVGASDFSNVVDMFHVTDNKVERISNPDLSLTTGRSELSVAAIDKYILAMGGYDGSNAFGSSNVVDVFQIV